MPLHKRALDEAPPPVPQADTSLFAEDLEQIDLRPGSDNPVHSLHKTLAERILAGEAFESQVANPEFGDRLESFVSTASRWAGPVSLAAATIGIASLIF